LDLLEHAIACDPSYGPALARAASCCFQLVIDDRSQDPGADRLKGVGFARRALDVAGDDPTVLVDAAQTLAYFGEDIYAMIALVDRALALNPSFARGWQISGVVRNWAGQPNVAIEHVAVGLRLSPRIQLGRGLFQQGYAHFVSRQYSEAVAKLLLAIQQDPSQKAPYRCLAACYGRMGRLEEAREIVARLRALKAEVIPANGWGHLRSAEHREFFLSGLRLAMGETE
jgi:adenylate cyclase